MVNLNLKTPPPAPKRCPKRNGKPCLKSDECAWWDDQWNECAMLSYVLEMGRIADLLEKGIEFMTTPTVIGINRQDDMKIKRHPDYMDDDDVPF